MSIALAYADKLIELSLFLVMGLPIMSVSNESMKTYLREAVSQILNVASSLTVAYCIFEVNGQRPQASLVKKLTGA
jgi:hypothetical protein